MAFSINPPHSSTVPLNQILFPSASSPTPLPMTSPPTAVNSIIAHFVCNPFSPLLAINNLSNNTPIPNPNPNAPKIDGSVDTSSFKRWLVNIVRPFVVRTLQAFYKHDSPEMIQQPVQMPSTRPQVTDRVPRVMIYRLIRGSIEERMMQMTKKKMVLEHLVVCKLKTQNINQALHNKIIELENQIDQRQALALEIEQLKGAAQVMQHIGRNAETKKRMEAIKEDLKDLKDLVQTMRVMEKKSHNELRDARKEMIDEEVSQLFWCHFRLSRRLHPSRT